MNKLNHPHQEDRGFILLTALAFLFIITTVGLALVQASIQTLNLSIRHSYTQISHIASKAAIDYAEEQYELNPSYNGTAEMDLLINSRYRVTIEVQVLYQESSTSKRVQAFGRVYIPEISNNADYVRDIKSSIIRNGEVIGTIDPSDYNPVLWLDANEPNSLMKVAAVNGSQYINGLSGSSSADLVEEGGSDAQSSNRGVLFFGTDDIEMSYDGSNRGHQWTGLRFRGITTPKNATINQAYIQFMTDETKQSGAVQLRVRGIASDNPGSWSGTYAVSGSPKTTASITWDPPNWNNVGNSGANERVDVTAIVQELVNRAGWTPNNAMSFAIDWVTGSGIRTAEMGNGGGTPSPQLYISWQIPGNYATTDGDSIVKWEDKSLNNNDAAFAYGTSPVLKLSQINGLNAVRFSADGVLRSALSSTMSGNSVTAFMMMLPRTTTQTDGRFLSILNSSSTNDSSGANSMSPFYKDGSTTNIRQRYNNTAARTLSTAINGSWSMFSSRITSLYVERLIRNSTPDNYNEDISSVNYSFNEIFVGGTRNSSAGYRYADADIAEVVVYNSALTCQQIQEIENYFSQRYSISIAQKSC